MSAPDLYSDNVFVNCPFDVSYKGMFEAIIFTIHDCGFISRCAREENDSGNIRIVKIMKIIDECKYGIHDISKADLDPTSGLARFNMPLELGLFMGAKNYASPRHYNREKRTLILDTEPFRYQQFISDLAGQDINAHHMSVAELITQVRDFLFSYAKRTTIPGGPYINDRFDNFNVDIVDLCDTLHWDRNNLPFQGYLACVLSWINDNPI